MNVNSDVIKLTLPSLEAVEEPIDYSDIPPLTEAELAALQPTEQVIPGWAARLREIEPECSDSPGGMV